MTQTEPSVQNMENPLETVTGTGSRDDLWGKLVGLHIEEEKAPVRPRFASSHRTSGPL